MTEIQKAAQAMGRIKTEKKSASARENGKKGGNRNRTPWNRKKMSKKGLDQRIKKLLSGYDVYELKKEGLWEVDGKRIRAFPSFEELYDLIVKD